MTPNDHIESFGAQRLETMPNQIPTTGKQFAIADLFCGAGGTSTGAVEALEALGHDVELTAINHWKIAVATHTANHPGARHLCASLDALNPRDLYKPGELQLLWASPECTHHSIARGGKPINDQSRATAWCVTRWAEALLPPTILIENVPEFRTWGPIGANGKPLKSRKGEIFRSWVGTLESMGYKVDHRVLVAADYGDPTTRKRLFVQAVRGRREICWPEPTHAQDGRDGLSPWVPAAQIIDWNLEGQSIFERTRPLSDKTLRRIEEGLRKFGLKPFVVGQEHTGSNGAEVRDVGSPLSTVSAHARKAIAEPFIITMEHQGSVRSIKRPLPTITTAKGGAMALANPFLVRYHGDHKDRDNSARCAQPVENPIGTITTKNRYGLVQPFLVHARGQSDACELGKPAPTITCSGGGHLALCEPHLLPQQSDGRLRPVSEPSPTVSTAGAIGLVEPFLVKFYGTAGATSVREPLDTVTVNDRFGLVRPVIEIEGERYLLDIRFRMLQPHELAGAQGFRSDYKFTGTKTEIVKQIGNAVPRRLARALVLASVGQRTNIAGLLRAA